MDIQGLLRGWLIDHQQVLSIRGIEVELKMPPDTLQKVMQGTRKLPQKWIRPLLGYLDAITESWLYPQKYRKCLEYDSFEEISLHWELTNCFFNPNKRKKRLDYIPKLDNLMAELKNNIQTFVQYLLNVDRLLNEIDPIMGKVNTGMLFLSFDSLTKIVRKLTDKINAQPQREGIEQLGEQTTEFYS